MPVTSCSWTSFSTSCGLRSRSLLLLLPGPASTSFCLELDEEEEVEGDLGSEICSFDCPAIVASREVGCFVALLSANDPD